MQGVTEGAWRSTFQIFTCPVINNNCVSFLDQGNSFKKHCVFSTILRSIILSRCKKFEGLFVELDGLEVKRQSLIEITSVSRQFPFRTFLLSFLEEVVTSLHKFVVFALLILRRDLTSRGQLRRKHQG